MVDAPDGSALGGPTRELRRRLHYFQLGAVHRLRGQAAQAAGEPFPRLRVLKRHAAVPQGGCQRIHVVRAQRYVVQAFAPLPDVLCERRVGRRRLHHLQVATANGQDGCPQAPRWRLALSGHGQAQRLAVEAQSRRHVAHGDPHVMNVAYHSPTSGRLLYVRRRRAPKAWLPVGRCAAAVPRDAADFSRRSRVLSTTKHLMRTPG